MRIVIDIPEDYYKAIKEIPVEQSTADMLIIRNGTPLPKGHGRLIDADKLKPEARFIRKDGVVVYVPAVPIMKVVNAPTIIEADAESEGNT